MEHLGIYRIDDHRPPVVVLQYPTVDTGDFVLAAPLYPEGAAKPIEIVTPRIILEERPYLLGTHLMSGIPVVSLKARIGSARAFEYDIARALSRLFFGN